MIYLFDKYFTGFMLAQHICLPLLFGSHRNNLSILVIIVFVLWGKEMKVAWDKPTQPGTPPKENR